MLEYTCNGPKAGLTPHMEPLREAHFTELLTTNRAMDMQVNERYHMDVYGEFMGL